MIPYVILAYLLGAASVVFLVAIFAPGLRHDDYQFPGPTAPGREQQSADLGPRVMPSDPRLRGPAASQDWGPPIDADTRDANRSPHA